MSSVSFVFCRRLIVTQSNSSFDLVDRTMSTPISVSNYTFVETMTVGWTQGPRSRVKRHRDLDKAYQYVNKLLIHGYLSDRAYSDAWSMLLQITPDSYWDKEKVDSLKPVPWELFPYDWFQPSFNSGS